MKQCKHYKIFLNLQIEFCYRNFVNGFAYFFFSEFFRMLKIWGQFHKNFTSKLCGDFLSKKNTTQTDFACKLCKTLSNIIAACNMLVKLTPVEFRFDKIGFDNFSRRGNESKVDLSVLV